METESWLDNYLTPISLGAEDAELPKQQLYKDINYLRVQPDEGTVNHENRNQFTFTNRNLDIIQNLHEAYIEYDCVFHTTEIKAMEDAAGDPSDITIKGILDEFFEPKDIQHTDRDGDGTEGNDEYEHPEFVFPKFYATCLPQTAFWVDGYTFELNDTTISTINSGLARSLNVLNHGKYAAESRQLNVYGMTFGRTGTYDQKSPFELEKYKIPFKNLRLKIPLRYVIPYLSTNKISWGVKTSIKLTKLNATELNKIFSVIPGSDQSDFKVDIKNIELVVPYVKLENNKQLSLWNQMYSSVNNRYWLENDLFTSSVYDNTISHTNEVYRIATKGLNSRPRWLLLSAIDPDCYLKRNYWNTPFTPLGFSGKIPSRYQAGATGENENSLKLTKVRVKINGIYIDGGKPLEFKNVSSTRDLDTMPEASYGGDYLLAYENYCKFFGQYHSKRATPRDFGEWLQSQVFAFDLVNIDAENIFANSGNALIIEVEFSTVAGAWNLYYTANATDGAYDVQNTGSNPYGTFKLVANVLYDKQLSISHSNNSAILTVT